jgi:hypothetical protein
VIGTYKAPGVRHRLGNLERLFPEGTTLSEQAELGMARGEPNPGDHGGQKTLGEALVALVALRSVQRRHSIVNRPTIVALVITCLAEVLVRLQENIPASRGE